MPHIYSLAYLTSAPMAPPDALVLAAKLSYQAIGVRIAPAAPGGDFSPLATDGAMLREVLRRIDDTGVTVFDVEIARLNADFTPDRFARFVETAGRLKASAILVAGDDPDEARLTESFAAFCRTAAPYGLTADLEFMPWTAVKNARAALRIVTNAGEPNGRVLVDALHAARSTTTLDDIANLPRQLLSYAQLCDAPAGIPASDDELIHTARCARLLPGDGGIDLPGILRALPGDLPFSIEIPNHEWLPKLGAEEWGRRALVAARRIVARAAEGKASA
ncbi:xylose isomerase [Bradyrhizobium sp. CCBAU 51745]|uniref:sugar phosphate isomerase/epimerase family protein n=1 Tax=Bradyrhizobium sp. CCBAU 51745 TaxID=1325099 RepID=UPI0023069EA8|nr:sugar phosphate isomerase/epimerase [Bradyrhizobium sp. CCBAU 51745]MDA9440649.1 xylose isomerase [Bradyrhizobium sp. CCBAU 51745]